MAFFTEELYNKIKHEFGHIPTQDQDTAMDYLSQFLLHKEMRSLFIMRGYAGTGKTSLLAALVKVLRSEKKPVVLMAPTGRAAKVLSNYTEYFANTIHRRIYFATTKEGGYLNLKLQVNKLKNAVFIVDEASMIPDVRSEAKSGGRNLLADLVEFVFTDPNNKLIFVGDTAQLPPVGLAISPALNSSYLKSNFAMNVHQHELKEVVRQKQNSGILDNATALRDFIEKENYEPPFLDDYGYKDMVRIPGNELQDELDSYFNSKNFEETLIITRSNKRANQFNQEIRKRILYKESEIDAGDLLMIVKNNYFWLPEDSHAGFLANGDIVEVLKVVSEQEKFGFRFATLLIRLIDYPQEKEYEVNVILDTIEADGPALNSDENNRLFEEAMLSHAEVGSRQKQLEQVRKDPFFNALQVKFAYAMTCHKTQGGQWPIVFIDQAYLRDDMIDKEYLRWLYTAMTRSTERVFLINFADSFFK